MLQHLTVSMLVYRSPSNDNPLLYWALVAANQEAPALFATIWRLYGKQLSILDFRRSELASKQHASPHWLLACAASRIPTIYREFLQRFGNTLTGDDFIELMSDPSMPGYECSIFGLLIHHAAEHPVLLNQFWVLFLPILKAKILNNPNEMIAGNRTMPITSLGYAVEAGSVDCSLLHYCLQQLGDLRPCMLTFAALSGDIVQRNGNNAVLFNIHLLLVCKDRFFDALAKRSHNLIHDAELREAAQLATTTGFHNAYYFLALFYKQFGQDDIAHDVLKKLPTYSIFHNQALISCIAWQLRHAGVAHGLGNELYKSAFEMAFRITEPTKQGAQLQMLAYSFLHNGKTMPRTCSGPLTSTQLAALQANPNVKALLKFLRGRKAAKIYDAIDDQQLQLPPAPVFLPSFSSMIDRFAEIAPESMMPPPSAPDGTPEINTRSFLLF